VPAAATQEGLKLALSQRPGRAILEGQNADVAQLVEHHLAKVRVAGSNPVVRSVRPSDQSVRSVSL